MNKIAGPCVDESISVRLFQIVLLAGGCLLASAAAAPDDTLAARHQADVWRAKHRIIDLRQHLDCKPELLARAIQVMDESGVGLAVDLTPGTVTRGPSGEPGGKGPKGLKGLRG